MAVTAPSQWLPGCLASIELFERFIIDYSIKSAASKPMEFDESVDGVAIDYVRTMKFSIGGKSIIFSKGNYSINNGEPQNLTDPKVNKNIFFGQVEAILEERISPQLTEFILGFYHQKSELIVFPIKALGDFLTYSGYPSDPKVDKTDETLTIKENISNKTAKLILTVEKTVVGFPDAITLSYEFTVDYARKNEFTITNTKLTISANFVEVFRKEKSVDVIEFFESRAKEMTEFVKNAQRQVELTGEQEKSLIKLSDDFDEQLSRIKSQEPARPSSAAVAAAPAAVVPAVAASAKVVSVAAPAAAPAAEVRYTNLAGQRIDPRRTYLRQTDYLFFDPNTEVFGCESLNSRGLQQGQTERINQDTVFSRNLTPEFSAKFRSWDKSKKKRFAGKLSAAIQTALKKHSNRYRFIQSGSTLNLAFIDNKNDALISGVGDSTQYAIVQNADGTWTVKLLNKIHHPDIPAEKARLESIGADIVDRQGTKRVALSFGVNQSIAISREMGMFGGEQDGLISIPDISNYSIPKDAKQVFFLSVCDGAYESFPGNCTDNSQCDSGCKDEANFRASLPQIFADKFVEQEITNEQMLDVVRTIRNSARTTSTDDISIMLKRIDRQKTDLPIQLLGLADGNGVNGEKASSAIRNILSNELIDKVAQEIDDGFDIIKERNAFYDNVNAKNYNPDEKTLVNALPEARMSAPVLNASIISRLTLGHNNMDWEKFEQQGTDNKNFFNVFSKGGKKIAVLSATCDTGNVDGCSVLDESLILARDNFTQRQDVDKIFIPIFSKPGNGWGERCRLLLIERKSEGTGFNFTLIDSKGWVDFFYPTGEIKNQLKTVFGRDTSLKTKRWGHKGTFDRNNNSARYIVDYVEQISRGIPVSGLYDNYSDPNFIRFEGSKFLSENSGMINLTAKTPQPYLCGEANNTENPFYEMYKARHNGSEPLVLQAILQSQQHPAENIGDIKKEIAEAAAASTQSAAPAPSAAERIRTEAMAEALELEKKRERSGAQPASSSGPSPAASGAP